MTNPRDLKYTECPKCKEYGFHEDSECCCYCGFDIEDAQFQWECERLEKLSQNDSEYVNRIAKQKTESYLEEINDKLGKRQ